MAIKTILIIIVLATLSSCYGQDESNKNETSNDSFEIGEMVSVLDNKIWAIFQDQKGNYWFGSNGNGVFHFDGKNLKQLTKKDGLVDNTIRGIQGDHLGNVFIETPEGVSKFDGETFSTLKVKKSTNNKWELEPNDLWFNCNGIPNDIYRYDGESLIELKLPRKNLNEAFGTEVQGLSFKGMNTSPYSVFGIDKDREGNLWVGTIVAGAYRYDGKSFLWIAENELSTLPDGRVPGVRSMIEDKDGNIWLSNFISKYRITKNDSNVTYEKLEGLDMSKGHFETRLPYFISGLSDVNGDLWMTTYTGGVWKYDGDQLLNFPIKDGETEVLLISIYKDNQGSLWLGTDNAGVYKFNGGNFEKFIPMKN